MLALRDVVLVSIPMLRMMYTLNSTTSKQCLYMLCFLWMKDGLCMYVYVYMHL